jgi:hypothetical protein
VQYGSWSISAAASSTPRSNARVASGCCALALKDGLTSPLFGPAMKLGQWLRPLLPASLKGKVPARPGRRRTAGRRARTRARC